MYRAQNWLRSISVAFDLSDAQGIKHVLHCHPLVASLHATDEKDQPVPPTPQLPVVNDQRIHDLELAAQAPAP